MIQRSGKSQGHLVSALLNFVPLLQVCLLE